MIHTGADDSINESETKRVSLSIIHTRAEDSFCEFEFIIRCISLLIIHTGPDDSIYYRLGQTS